MKKRIPLGASFIILALLLWLPLAAAETDVREAARAADEAVGRRIGDYVFTGQDGERFRTRDLLGKPLVLNFIYTECGHVCPAIMTSLDKAIRSSPGIGTGFTALTIGLDPDNDTPGRMREYGRRVSGGLKGWRFAAGDKAAIEGLAKDAGFYFRKTKDGYDHLNLVTVIGPDGRVVRQVYGTGFKAAELTGAVEEAASGAVSRKAPRGFLDRLKLLCYTYDEATGTYTIDYAFFATVALGVLVQITFGLLLFYLLRRRPVKRPLVKHL